MNISSFHHDGWLIIPSIYSRNELEKLESAIPPFRLQKEFGVREFILKHPEVGQILLSQKLKDILRECCSLPMILTKAIYFNKPSHANWLVPWHQDLTINLTSKKEADGFKNWRVLRERVVVQPSLNILENTVTVRMHLDDANEQNGALQVIKGSHKNGVISNKKIENYTKENMRWCTLKKGDIMLMKPLLLHSSKKTKINQSRRVIHLEFSPDILPSQLQWKEKMEVFGS